ncbi:MAG: adenylate/guanylate cyclase domain-containing protein [Leptospiraceae bacterium]|nr:adenylate/guanylate cyclase domain-containing protein [Leptospiraceae bacterium]MCP5511373.1 adenylate/guanylate cyclase domain-containing protein [Leptospiraceae bacterium]
MKNWSNIFNKNEDKKKVVPPKEETLYAIPVEPEKQKVPKPPQPKSIDTEKSPKPLSKKPSKPPEETREAIQIIDDKPKRPYQQKSQSFPALNLNPNETREAIALDDSIIKSRSPKKTETLEIIPLEDEDDIKINETSAQETLKFPTQGMDALRVTRDFPVTETIPDLSSLSDPLDFPPTDPNIKKKDKSGSKVQTESHRTQSRETLPKTEKIATPEESTTPPSEISKTKTHSSTESVGTSPNVTLPETETISKTKSGITATIVETARDTEELEYEDKRKKSRSKPKYSIQFKMLLVISLVLAGTTSTIIALASYFFKKDNKIRILENNLELVRVVELKVRADLNSVVDKGKQLALTLKQDFKSEAQKKFFIDQFFKNDNDFIFLGVYQNSDGHLKEIDTIFNDNYLKKISLDNDDIFRVVKNNEEQFLKSFSGASILMNTSQGFQEPTICISVPPLEANEESKVILVIMVKLESILDAFKKTATSETFMVGPDGTIIAHHEPEVVLTGKNIMDSPIVRNMLASQTSNGQTAFVAEDGERYLGSFQKLKLRFTNVGIISTTPESKAFEAVYRIQERNIYIMLISLCISLILVVLFSKTISSPILSLLSETVKISKGIFKIDIKRTTNDEVGILTDYFITMARGLEEREKVKSILGSMIDPVVVQEAMKDLQALKRGDEKVITAFFSDVASFSTISEQLNSVDLASLLNEYLSAMTMILQNHHGVLDKYIGDAIVGIFGAPVDVNHHYLHACKASLEMITKLDDLRNYWTKNNLYSKEAQMMDVRIGLNTGPAKVGFMGTDNMGSFTMMGDTVNLAARLEAAGKDYGVNILVSEMIKKNVDQEMFTRELDLVRVKGKNEPVRLYELISLRSNIPVQLKESTALYEEAFQYYIKKDFNKSINLLNESIRSRGKKDKAANLLIERCEAYISNPPPEDWDGVFTRTHK